MVNVLEACRRPGRPRHARIKIGRAVMEQQGSSLSASAHSAGGSGSGAAKSLYDQNARSGNTHSSGAGCESRGGRPGLSVLT